MRKKLKKRK